MPEVWQIFCEELYLIDKFFNFKTFNFVLMNNHFHLIGLTPDANLDRCMQQFMKQTSKRLTEKGNRINQTYCGRYYKTILHKSNYYLNAYKYIYRNPVAAGVVEKVEEYPFSTLQGLIGKSSLIVPVVEDSTLFTDFSGTLKWLNRKPCEEKMEAVRWALKRPYFVSKKCKNTRKLILSDDELL